MNQFNNIGSMFPGPEHKLTRDKAKHVLSVNPQYKITGMVMTNDKGETCIVDKSAVRWLNQSQMWEIMQNEAGYPSDAQSRAGAGKEDA